MKNFVILKIITLALLILAAPGCSNMLKPPAPESATSSTNTATTTAVTANGAANTAATTVAATVTAETLGKVYNENIHRAESLYDSKILIVSGTVDTIGEDLMGTPLVSLKTGEMVYSVQVYFAESEKSKVGNLNKGQKISVRGFCDGVGGNVLIKDAVMQ